MSRGPTIPALLILVLLSLPTGPLAAQDYRLGTEVKPTFQSVSLTLDADQPTYQGSVHVELEVFEPTDSFRFHAEAMTLDRIVLKQGDTEIPVTPSEERSMVRLTAASPLAPGTYTLDIAFNDDFNTDAVGLYRMETGGSGYAFTQFEADDAREAFPCWDEPAYKIPYQMIVTVPEGHLAIANTPVESETTADGWKTTVFKTTPPTPSYLLALATGPLETVEIPGLGVPGRVITVRGQSHLTGAAIETAAPLLKALEAYFGRAYPYEKLDLIAVPEYWAGAMENPGAITYSDEILLVDPDNVSAGQMRGLIRVSAHEFAHMWFGDLVTMEWWDDLWLNESFADWLGDKIADQVYPEYQRGLTTIQSGQEIMNRDAQATTRPIRRPVEGTGNLLDDIGLTYDKGKAVLAMFEAWLGPEVFRTGVVNYINANAWGNATADDLWGHLDQASGKTVSNVLAGFIEQPGVPCVHVESMGNGSIRLRQTRFSNYGVNLDPLTWKIPVGLKYAVDGTVKEETVLLDWESQVVELGAEPDWIFPNAGAKGYYRWSLGAEQFSKLASVAGKELEPGERIALLSNSESMLLSGPLSGEGFFSFLAGFADDENPMVLRCLLDALAEIRTALVQDEDQDAFGAYIRRTLGPALDRIGLEPRPGEDETISLIRPQLIEWLGDVGQKQELREFARDRALAVLEDPTAVDPAIQSVALRLAARDGDRTLLTRYQEAAATTSNPAIRGRLIQAIGYFTDPELMEAAMAYALSPEIRPNEMFDVVRGLASTPAGQAFRYDWMTRNYDSIVQRIPGVYRAFMPFFAGGCSAERLERAREFFALPEHQVDGTQKQLDQIAESTEECLKLREREGPSASRYLASVAARMEDD